MPEAVIVATARTPIGRAMKGSLVTMRPDDLHRVHRRGRARPRSPSWTAPRRGPDHGLRPARRRVRLQHGPRRRHPGRHARRPRRHRQPLLLLVAADHPHGHPRHPRRRGRRLRRRRRRDRQPLPQRHGRRGPAPRTRASPRPRPAPPSARPAASADWTPAEGLPDVYIAMGETAENVAELEGTQPRGDGRVRRPLPAAGRPPPWRTASGRTRSPRCTTADEGNASVSRDDGIRARHHRRGPGQAQARPSAPTAGHRRQRLPAQRRRRRRGRHERHPGRRAGHHPARPRRLLRRDRPQPRDHGPRARSRPAGRPSPAPA